MRLEYTRCIRVICEGISSFAWGNYAVASRESCNKLTESMARLQDRAEALVFCVL